MRDQTEREVELQAEVAALRQRVAELEACLHTMSLKDNRVAPKQREGALQQSNRQLAQRNATLEAQNAELEAFAHTVAHELKAPLAGMLGFVDIVLADAPLDEMAREQMEYIVRYGAKMEGVIDALLLLAELDGEETVKRRPLEMAAVVEAALERVALYAREMGAKIVPPAGAWPVALGYAPWVEEVWVNYLSNALKYGGRPPQIELGATNAPAGGVARFWVRDNGPGLSPDQQLRLFTPFTQLHKNGPDALLHPPSHGLGLSIVKRIVHKLGGDVSCSSNKGEGSTFAFTLPAA